MRKKITRFFINRSLSPKKHTILDKSQVPPAFSQVLLGEKQAPAIYQVSFAFSHIAHNNDALFFPDPHRFQGDRSAQSAEKQM